MSDDFLRARITVLEELIKSGPGIVAEWDREQATKDAERQYPEDLKQRAELGRIGPLPLD